MKTYQSVLLFTLFNVLLFTIISSLRNHYKLIVDVTVSPIEYTKESSRVAQLLNDLEPQQFQFRNQTPPEDHRIIGVLPWFGGDFLEYVSLTLQTARRASSRFFVLIFSVDSEPFFCPNGASERVEENVKYLCVSKSQMETMFANSMCEEWKCSEEERKTVLEGVQSLMTKNPNKLQLFLQNALKEHLSFPGVNKFSHWFRMSHDVLIGEMDFWFPWSHLDDFDVISFGSVKWKHLYFPTGSTFFRLTDEVGKAWIDVEGLQNPNSFVKEYVEGNEGWKSKVEGGLARSIVLINTGIRFVSFAKFFQLSAMNKWNNHLDIRGGTELKSFIVTSSGQDDERFLKLHKLKPSLPKYDDPPIFFFGRVRVHSMCDEMTGILHEDALCVDSVIRDDHPNGESMKIWREGPKGNIVASKTDDYTRLWDQNQPYHRVPLVSIAPNIVGQKISALKPNEMISTRGAKWNLLEWK